MDRQAVSYLSTRVFPLLITLLYLGAGGQAALRGDWRQAIYGCAAAALTGVVYL